MRKWTVAAFTFLLIMLAIGSIILILNRDKIGEEFFQVKIIELLSLLSSIVIGFIFTYLISVSFQKENKQKEIISDALSAIQEDIAHTMEYVEGHENHPISNNIRTHILRMSTLITNDIHILNRLCKENAAMNNCIVRLLENRKEFHYKLTGDGLVSGQQMTHEYVSECIVAYYPVKQDIFQCKIEIFNS